MISSLPKLFLGLFLLLAPFLVEGQRNNLDKQMKKIRNESGLFSCNLPGWSLRFVYNQLDEEFDDEVVVLDQLLRHTKRLRMVIAENKGEKTMSKLNKIHELLERSRSYENLLKANSYNGLLSLWAKQEGNIVKEIFLSFTGRQDKTVLIKIKSDLPMDRLEQLPFYREGKS